MLKCTIVLRVRADRRKFQALHSASAIREALFSLGDCKQSASDLNALLLLSGRAIGGSMKDAIPQVVLQTVTRVPDWIRHDLNSKDATLRLRAEETLAAILVSAIEAGNAEAVPR